MYFKTVHLQFLLLLQILVGQPRSTFGHCLEPPPKLDECEDFLKVDVLVRGIPIWQHYPDGPNNEQSFFGGGKKKHWYIDRNTIAKVKLTHVYFPKSGRLKPSTMIRVRYPQPGVISVDSFSMDVGVEYALGMKRDAGSKLYEIRSGCEPLSRHFTSMSLDQKQVWERCGNRRIQSQADVETNLDEFEYDFTVDELFNFFALVRSSKLALTMFFTVTTLIGWRSGFFRRCYRHSRRKLLKSLELKDSPITGKVSEVV
jgi:hypothetical protein